MAWSYWRWAENDVHPDHYDWWRAAELAYHAEEAAWHAARGLPFDRPKPPPRAAYLRSLAGYEIGPPRATPGRGVEWYVGRGYCGLYLTVAGAGLFAVPDRPDPAGVHWPWPWLEVLGLPAPPPGPETTPKPRVRAKTRTKRQGVPA